MTMRVLKLCSTATVLVTAVAANPSVSHAQSIIDQLTGAPGVGGDMFTQNMAIRGLFVPHTDDCNATTEVFVQTGENASSVAIGFCMDKDEHSSGSKEFEDARVECLEDGKRLPEPDEFKYACDSITGLNSMTDDWEWSSNFTTQGYKSYSPYYHGTFSAIAGSGSCKKGAVHWHANTASGASSNVFRCVR